MTGSAYFAYEEGRWEPPVTGDEGVILLGFLERQRATFAWKSGGLDAAGLRATLGPSAIAAAKSARERATASLQSA